MLKEDDLVVEELCHRSQGIFWIETQGSIFWFSLLKKCKKILMLLGWLLQSAASLPQCIESLSNTLIFGL